MRLYDVMQAPVITIAAEATLQQAYDVMRWHRIAHLPVLAQVKLVGLLSRGALQQRVQEDAAACPSGTDYRRWNDIPVHTVMQRQVRTMPPQRPAREAARRLWHGQTSCILVAQGDTLIGMVTTSDVLDLFIALIEEHRLRPYERLLVATNFGRAAMPAVAKALTLARQYGAKLTILHVLARLSTKLAADMEHISTELVTRMMDDCYAEALDRLHALLPPAMARGVVYEVRTGEPALEILRAAARHQADLIVMGSGRRSGWRALLLPNVTRQVTRMASCPVLVVQDGGRYELVHAIESKL